MLVGFLIFKCDVLYLNGIFNGILKITFCIKCKILTLTFFKNYDIICLSLVFYLLSNHYSGYRYINKEKWENYIWNKRNFMP